MLSIILINFAIRIVEFLKNLTIITDIISVTQLIFA